MRLLFSLLCTMLCAGLALCGENKDTPNIAPKPLSLGDISRFSNRLRDIDNAKAIIAARELAETRAPNAAKLLIDFYTPGDGERRMAAIKAFGVLGDKTQCPALLNVALMDILGSVRRQAAQELARLEGNDPALKRFMEASIDVKRYTPLARNRAVHCAAIIGQNNVITYLRDILIKTDFETAIAAAEELGELRETASVDALLQSLNSNRDDVKPAVVAALERLTGRNFQYDLVKWSEWRKAIAQTPNAPGGASGASVLKMDFKSPESAEKLPVDLIVAFDTTASFVHAWPDVDRSMDAVLREISKTELSPRIGLVRYRSVDPRTTLKYSLWPTPLTWTYETIRRELSVAAFGGGSGALHEGLRYALNGMLWRERSRKVILIVGDDTPYSPVEDAMKVVLQLTRDASVMDGIQINALYTRTSAGEENRVTFRRISDAGMGRFYEFNKAERHLVDMLAEKIDVKKTELPAETAQKWLTPRK